MRAWDVDWGTAKGEAVIENNYVDVKDVLITSGESSMQFDGRFSTGFPRRDGGEELNARIRVINRPVADLRHAFGIDDYRVDGKLSGEFHVFGPYQRPLGFGNMSLTDGMAYGESFQTALAGLRFEGEGVRLDNIQVTKNGGRATGAAFVGWTKGSYSFNLDARDIPVESVALARNEWFQLSGLLDFSAGGSGTFEDPRYAVKGTVRDLFAGDEGIGQLGGEINLVNNLVTLKVEAASPRLAVSSTGRMDLTPGRNADILFRVTDTSLDPYVRTLLPRLSPFTTAVASGSIHVVGQLSDIDHLVVDTTVDAWTCGSSTTACATPRPRGWRSIGTRAAGRRAAGRRRHGAGVSGTANLRDEQMAVRVQAATPTSASSRASRPTSAPRAGRRSRQRSRAAGAAARHGCDDGAGRPHPAFRPAARAREHPGTDPVRLAGIRLDDLSARLGGGPVQFGGSIGIDGYRLGQIDVTMKGEQMRLRFPEGMRSLADADLTLRGTTAGATLSGQVLVRDAVYASPFNTGSGCSTSRAPPRRRCGRRPSPDDAAASLRHPDRRPVHAAGAQQQHPPHRPRRPPAARHLRSTAAAGTGRRGTRGSDVRRAALRRHARCDRSEQPDAHRAVLRPRDRDARARARRDLPCHAAGLGHAGSPEHGVQLGSLAATGRDSGAALQRRGAGARRRVPPVQHRHHAAATVAARARDAGGHRALSSEVARVVEHTFGVDTFQLTPSLADPNLQSSRLDPAARVTIGKRISDRLYLTYTRSLSSSTQRPDLPAGIRSDRPVLVDPVPERGSDLRARRAGEKELLMGGAAGSGRAAPAVCGRRGVGPRVGGLPAGCGAERNHSAKCASNAKERWSPTRASSP